MATKIRQDFKLHEEHVDGIPHNIEECGICEVRVIIREGISALIEDAYGPQSQSQSQPQPQLVLDPYNI